MAILVTLWLATSMVGVVRNAAPKMSVVVGRQSVDDYLLTRGPEEHNFTAYDAHLFMNQQLPADALILLWEHRGYYMERPLSPCQGVHPTDGGI